MVTRCFIVDRARGLFVGVELERVLYWGGILTLVGGHVLWGGLVALGMRVTTSDVGLMFLGARRG